MAETGRKRRFIPEAFKQEAVAAVRGGRPRRWQPSRGYRIGWCVPVPTSVPCSKIMGFGTKQLLNRGINFSTPVHSCRSMNAHRNSLQVHGHIIATYV